MRDQSTKDAERKVRDEIAATASTARMNIVVNLSDYRRVNHGNGAREALCRALALTRDDAAAMKFVDGVLAYLWREGFKIAPLTPADDGEGK